MLELVTRHKHPLEYQDALVIKAKGGHEIFIYAGKGYPYHRTNESPGWWYLVLASRSLIKAVTGNLTANQSVEILLRDPYEIVILLIGKCVV